jgi:hypothetical protein
MILPSEIFLSLRANGLPENKVETFLPVPPSTIGPP